MLTAWACTLPVLVAVMVKVISSPRKYSSLFEVLVIVKSVETLIAASAVAEETFSPPFLLGVGVRVVAVLDRLPVAFAAILPVMVMTLRCPFGMSASVVLPGQGALGPPSMLYCAFSTPAGTASVTIGAFAAEGPSLITVIV